MNSSVLQQFCIERRIEGSLLETLNELEPADEAVVLRLIEELRPSANTLRDWLRLVGEIARRDKIPISVVLPPESFPEILGGEEIPAKVKQKRLKRFLEKRRYPEKYSLEIQAADLSQAIRKRYGISPIVPAELEGDALQFVLSARSCSELLALAERIQKAASGPETEQLFSLLLGERLPGAEAVPVEPLR